MDAKFDSNARKIVTILVLFAFLMISISAVSATTSDNPQWSKQASDNQNTGQSPYLGPQKNTTKFNKSFSENDSSAGGPVVSKDGTVYIGTNNFIQKSSTLHALNPDGSVKWVYNLKDTDPQIDATPTLGSDGTIYLTTSHLNNNAHHAKLYALQDSGTSAKVKWSYDVPGSNTEFSSSAVIGSDGTIYVGVNKIDVTKGVLFALKPSGGLKWAYDVPQTTNWIVGYPAIGFDKTIYFNVQIPVAGGMDAALYALKDMKTYASKKWLAVIDEGEGDWFRGAPAIGPDGTIYVCENSWISNPTYIVKGNLFAFKDNGASAALKWKYTLNSGQSTYVNSGPAVAKDGTIYFGGEINNNFGLYAIKDLKTSASQKWKFQTESPVRYPPIIGSDGTVYFGDLGRLPDTFFALEPSSGKVKWSYHTFPASEAAMAQDGTIYFAVGGEGPVGLLKTAKERPFGQSGLIAIKGPPANLYVKTTVDNPNPGVGEIVNVLFKVGNDGPNTAYNTILTYIIPRGLKFIKAWADVGTITYDPATRTVTWDIGDVPVGDPKGHVRLLALETGTFPVVPSLSTTTDDPNLSQRIGTSSISVKAASKNSSDDTVGMQPTGIPFAALILAFAMVIGGLFAPKRKK